MRANYLILFCAFLLSLSTYGSGDNEDIRYIEINAIDFNSVDDDVKALFTKEYGYDIVTIRVIKSVESKAYSAVLINSQGENVATVALDKESDDRSTIWCEPCGQGFDPESEDIFFRGRWILCVACLQDDPPVPGE